MKFTDIPQFPPTYGSGVHVDLNFLREHLEHWDRPDMGSPLIMNPEWQRGHVWTPEQKTSYMEYFLKGGSLGRNVYFNCSTWSSNYSTPIYCVDGLQRIQAALDFLDNKVPVFNGHYLKDFTERLRLIQNYFIFHMLTIRKKSELLRVYIDFNSGGTPHNPEEIKRIEKMRAEMDPDEKI